MLYESMAPSLNECCASTHPLSPNRPKLQCWLMLPHTSSEITPWFHRNSNDPCLLLDQSRSGLPTKMPLRFMSVRPSSLRATMTVASGDTRTAVDAYMFLLNWLERFPEYKGRDLYIAGESYSGHYVPQLATVIVALSELGLTDMNLKGIFVGNPYLDDYMNTKGTFEFLWNHGVISDEVWGNITEHCSFGRVEGTACGQAKKSFKIGDIDRYNIYAPVCIESPDGSLHSSSYLPGYDPCIGAYIDAYFNSPKVQKAMHVRAKTKWSECANLDWTDAPVSMVPTIAWLVDNGLRVWLYSGDMDDVCPITATRYSVKDLNLAVTKPWGPWYTPDSEVGGYAQQYEGGFTFASVRGAGHMVPSFQPKRSLVLFYSFMKGVLPPAVSI